MKEFKEKQIVGGISYGRAFIIKDNKEIVSNIIVKNKELELDNFKKALDSLKDDFAQVIKKTQSEDEKDIINTHLAFLEDEIFKSTLIDIGREFLKNYEKLTLIASSDAYAEL